MIHLTDDFPEVVHAMLYFLYHGHYSCPRLAVCSDASIDVKMYEAADYYAIPALAQFAVSKLTSRVATIWTKEEFADIVEEVFEQDLKSDALRDAVVEVAVKHASVLFQQGHCKRFRDVANTCPKFAAKVATKLSDLKGPEKADYIKLWIRCPHCNRHHARKQWDWRNLKKGIYCTDCAKFSDTEQLKLHVQALE